MKRLLPLFALALLAGCEQQASDGYRFEQAEYTQTDLRVTVTLYPTEEKLRAAAAAAGAPVQPGYEAVAWGRIRGPRHDQCDVHLLDPRVRYQPELIGHEFVHCVFGRFHPSQP